ncbi:hypothetical protein DASB73_029490 [Starmerella bacillaris]|uniref:PPM-type phosphatase domain-containing protein n=1 Tax=Starmerella bacillaris TaxID=1247836 RepID=A0AAV5RMV4_STABA|nr:hypothetical protein DASB73_029490 [Starmerella bacillaris]
MKPISSKSNATNSGEILSFSDNFVDIGVSTDCNKRFRKSMEDAHVVISDYLGLSGCCYLAVFDGHAGAQSSRACAAHLHVILANLLKDTTGGGINIQEALAKSFEKMDELLKEMKINHSGSTAVVAVCGYVQDGRLCNYKRGLERHLFVANVGDSRAVGSVSGTPSSNNRAGIDSQTHAESCADESSNNATEINPDAHGNACSNEPAHTENIPEETASVRTVADTQWIAQRLSYDHKGTDENEKKRVANAGGIIMNNRVNGMLAVTRSLGDLFMKEYVVGSPYTTDTTLTPNHHAVILASDGLWDVCTDENAVELVRSATSNKQNALECSTELLTHAIQELSADNLTVIVCLFKH